MDDMERHLAEQMADVLHTRISETEAILRLLRHLLADLEGQARCSSGVEFRDWNSWLKRFPA
jgi:hypothetical protein